MAFYSYVILLLAHIGIGAVAHGEDKPTEGSDVEQERGLEAKQAKPSDSPLPAMTGWGEGLLSSFAALTYHSSA